MKIRDLFYVLLHVSDYAASMKFYTDVVGLEVLQQEEGHFASLRVGDGELVLHFDDRPPESREDAGAVIFALRVDDAAAAREELAGKGIAVGKLVELDDGKKQFHLRDPDNYRLAIVQTP